MKRVRLIHWKPGEAAAHIRSLGAAGYAVDAAPFDGPPAMKTLRGNPPDAVLIDLTRLPSQGRDVGVWLRKTRSTRGTPIVFVEGDAATVSRVRTLLPDATFTEWGNLIADLAAAIANPPGTPVQPESVMAAYSGTPLPRKLGVKAGSVVALVRAPEGFEQILGALPEGAALHRRMRADCHLVIWFVRSRRELEARIVKVASATPAGGTWIAWPKKASGVKTDVTETVVRATGLANGLVDYKIAAIDATWSGLRFAKRR
jgi:CheY-like chemotaxis protein